MLSINQHLFESSLSTIIFRFFVINFNWDFIYNALSILLFKLRHTMNHTTIMPPSLNRNIPSVCWTGLAYFDNVGIQRATLGILRIVRLSATAIVVWFLFLDLTTTANMSCWVVIRTRTWDNYMNETSHDLGTVEFSKNEYKGIHNTCPY